MKVFGSKLFSKRTMVKKEIVIVSGLPRCGTSMMMQMLEAGGMEIVTDNVRKADDDNPRGYYELEAVKSIKHDISWLENCYGKVFKMVSLLLYNLPADKKYKVIFMKRDMAEMLASQHRMLKRLNKKSDESSKEKMIKNFSDHLRKVTKWIESQSNIEVLYMIYNNIIQKPVENAKLINQFLPDELDENKMAQVVEKPLYRQRRVKTESSGS